MFWTPQIQAYCVSFLVNSGGLTPLGAAGLVARWAFVESAGGPASVNPYSGAFGIAQWLGVRKSPIAGNTNLDAQLAYVVQELNGTEYRAAQVLRSAQTVDAAATGASMYERAGGYNAGTGRDNFTSTVAAHVPSVLANATGNPTPDYGDGGDGDFFGLPDMTGYELASAAPPSGSANENNAPPPPAPGANDSTALLVGLAAVLVYMFVL